MSALSDIEMPDGIREFANLELVDIVVQLILQSVLIAILDQEKFIMGLLGWFSMR